MAVSEQVGIFTVSTVILNKKVGQFGKAKCKNQRNKVSQTIASQLN